MNKKRCERDWLNNPLSWRFSDSNVHQNDRKDLLKCWLLSSWLSGSAAKPRISFLTRSQLIQILLLWDHTLRTIAVPRLLSTQKLRISQPCLKSAWGQVLGLRQGRVYTTSKPGLRITRAAFCSPSPFPGPLWRLRVQGGSPARWKAPRSASLCVEERKLPLSRETVMWKRNEPMSYEVTEVGALPNLPQYTWLSIRDHDMNHAWLWGNCYCVNLNEGWVNLPSTLPIQKDIHSRYLKNILWFNVISL